MHHFLLTTLILLSPVLVSLGSAAEKYALLVGVTKYNHAQMNKITLKFPEADAKAMAEMLGKSGYEVQLLLGKAATKTAVTNALTKAEKEGKAGGVVFIGLFGHGVQYGKDAYYGPFDTTIRKVTDSKGQLLRNKNGQPMLEPDPVSMVSMRSILDTLSVCAASNKVLIADCCREDPSAARGRAFGSNLRVADLPRGTAALFACSENEQAFEHDDWKHGAFTKALLDQCDVLASRGKVRVNSLSGPVYDSVLSLVSEKTNGRSTQTVNPIVNGIVDLQLVRLDREKLLTNGIGMKLTLIPSGEFLMGSPDDEEDRYDGEGPQHRIQISQPFYMGTYEVTQSEYERVSGENPAYFSRDGGGKEKVSGINTSRFPLESVSWDDAVEFCRKLTESERRAGRLTMNQQYTLPTEAQWEYACRAGTRSPFSSGSWLYGDEANINGNYPYGTSIKSPYLERTTTVGSYKANAFGLYDMHGNVFEWCQDWYDEEYYVTSPSFDPSGPTSGSSRVLRGGAWNLSAVDVRSAFRDGLSPDFRGSNGGFRVVLE